MCERNVRVCTNNTGLVVVKMVDRDCPIRSGRQPQDALCLRQIGTMFFTKVDSCGRNCRSLIRDRIRASDTELALRQEGFPLGSKISSRSHDEIPVGTVIC